jgi:hypothetical protein
MSSEDSQLHGGPVAPIVPPELRVIVRAGVRANREVPGAVALGGTVCALYAQHRLSMDIDFGLTDLRQRFGLIRDRLLEVDGWREANVRPPVLILGSLDGVEVGFRQLRRNTPMDTLELQTPDGPLIIPTLEELLRSKAFLLYSRNAARDFLDFAELSRLMPEQDVVRILAGIDACFAWEKQPSILLGVIKSLLHPEPADFDPAVFEAFRWLAPRLKTWPEIQSRCRSMGELLSLRVLEP